MAEKFKIVRCPTCGRPVEWRSENAWRPFCSERCKLIDLGAWAAEKYRVPSQAEPGEDSSP
ncbi:MAG: DNA gyrase inhibitor YacG [Pseudomonadota bacterium]